MNAENFKRLLDWIMREEQYCGEAFWDVKGYSIGFGRHGVECGIKQGMVIDLKTAIKWCQDDVADRFCEMADVYGGGWDDLSPVRQGCLVAMAYQLGSEGVAKFINTLTEIHAGNFEDAAERMLQSKWAKQTPARAQRTAKAMRSNEWPDPDTLPGINWETEPAQ